MRVVVVFTPPDPEVLNRRGRPNREVIEPEIVEAVIDALEAAGHDVAAVEDGVDLVDRLTQQLPSTIPGEEPGLVFNLAYGIQGRARYTHVPSVLEMLGLPYVGSGPLAHSLALDKVVAKMVFARRDLPTPEFRVSDGAVDDAAGIEFPVIVKPRHEAGSLGLEMASDATALRRVTGRVAERFRQPLLIERYVAGRELYVGLVGNDPPRALPVVELLIDGRPPDLFRQEDKELEGRELRYEVPAPIDDGVADEARRIAVEAFQELGCRDLGRADLRLDEDGRLFLLEVNSIPGLLPAGPYARAAAAAGLDYRALVDRLVQEAAGRCFGATARPAARRTARNVPEEIAAAVTARRGEIEDRLLAWTATASRTAEPGAASAAARRLTGELDELGLTPDPELTDGETVWTWTTDGIDTATVLALALDVPVTPSAPPMTTRRDGEVVAGEGVASTRAPLAIALEALRVAAENGRLDHGSTAVVACGDRGRRCRWSGDMLRRALSSARRVLGVEPGLAPAAAATGEIELALAVSLPPGDDGGDLVERMLPVLERVLTPHRGPRPRIHRIATAAEAGQPPHRLEAELVLGFPRETDAERWTGQVRRHLDSLGLRWHLDDVGTVPARSPDIGSQRMLAELRRHSTVLGFGLPEVSVAPPSLCGFAPETVPCLTGLGPPAERSGAAEVIRRSDLATRAVLLALMVAGDGPAT